MKLLRPLTLCLLIGLAGCSPQNPAPGNSSSLASQTPPAAAPPNASILQHNGCTIDFAKVCQTFIDQPTFTYNGDEYDWRRFQQSFSRHPDVEIWARYPDGNVVADIECHVDTQNRKIDWARLLPNRRSPINRGTSLRASDGARRIRPTTAAGRNTGAVQPPASEPIRALRTASL
ncbi:MAG TPA: hypothetical protein VJX68_18825 [Candidatus Binatus sp.]|uniref:hypothetical protein n=1 Tax=Candidatus Binatus sp. TaxID=2811406 RepID=UPI002B468FD9|nr:hypothetical protein [Candidatus Binatus sp.]HKN15250.1 hypothetical protein [Candidatus Binatus sp.]